MLNKNQHNIKGELKIQVARNRKAVMWILDICSSYHCPDMAPKCVSTRATKIVLENLQVETQTRTKLRSENRRENYTENCTEKLCETYFGK